MKPSKRRLSRESRGEVEVVGAREPARQAGGHWFEPSTAHEAPGARRLRGFGRRALACALRVGAARRRYAARLLAFGFVAFAP